jgi:hypothetical protein
MWDRVERFFLSPASPRPLGILRIGLAVILLCQAWMCHGQFFELYGSRGVLQGAVGEQFSRGGMLQPTQVARLFSATGVAEKNILLTLAIFYLVSLGALLVGFFTRTAAVAAWALHLLFAQGHFTGYGLDLYAHFALFYAWFMPMGASYSVDHWLARVPVEDSWQAGLSLRVWQIHLGIGYFAAGVEKAMGEQWRTGEAVWRSLMLPLYRQFDMGWMAQVPALALLAAWGTLVVEIGYPFLIFPTRTRLLWVALTLSLHISIAIFLGLHLFAALMSLLTLCCFGLTVKNKMRFA